MKTVSYAENRFMNKGVELQLNSLTWAAAKRNYEYSCMLCCARPGCGAVKCYNCPIRDALLTNAMVFRNKLTENDKKWVEKEKGLL